MRLGYCLPQVGSVAGPIALIEVARRAEELGYDSIWTLDRLLYPTHPRAPYPVTADGSLPDAYDRVLDPLIALTWVAAETERLALGTSILVLPWYNPVLLARSLASLDLLSGGRLRVGVGTGWSPDEYEAAGVPMAGRGARAEESLAVMNAIWKGGEVAHSGERFTVPESRMRLVPIQRPRPKVYMAAYTPAVLARVGEMADGWIPAGVPNAAIPGMFAAAQEAARAAGRGSDALELVIRANVTLLDEALPEEGRHSFAGSLEQIADDVAGLREIGANEIHFDTQFSPGVKTVDDHLELAERLYQVAQG
ncbi:MAG TPA: TIGR03619 family F420-dependent LLM class oxidoreductase [Thermoanaerobaculia bacterium]|nr:TIGR03619 family F420-dependent LLM class oxidoreductase [Thermoanaerobaculia bacterium]